jgi:hypothetical protein
MRRLWIFIALLLPATLAAEDWGPVQFLIGKWTGEGSGQPGNGSGSFSLLPELQGKILVRKSFSEYPAADGKPAARHDDLMIVYRQPGSGELRATYYDSEGHVIAYRVLPAEGGVAFVSDGPTDQMRYRLTYVTAGKDRARLKFEIASPGKDFSLYLEGTVRRE